MNVMRNVILSEEFESYYNSQPERVKKKFDYALNILRVEKVPNAKFVKHLTNTDFYELRVSIGSNEHRSILFAIDQDNIVEATQVLALNTFLKKSEKDYPQQIKMAESILKKFEV